MLSKVWNPFKSSVEGHEISKKAISSLGSYDGLKTLINISHNIDSNNIVVVKPCSKLTKPKTPLNQTSHDVSFDSCFLKSCFLCNKTLGLDKEVYMYRGDQGFCSIECRERQIYMNEMRELEKYAKKIMGSFRACRDNNDRCETTLLEEFEQRHD